MAWGLVVSRANARARRICGDPGTVPAISNSCIVKTGIKLLPPSASRSVHCFSASALRQALPFDVTLKTGIEAVICTGACVNSIQHGHEHVL